MCIMKATGILTPYLPTISAFLQQTNLYFIAKKIPEEKEVVFSLSATDSPSYSLFWTLTMPNLPQAKSITDLQKTLKG